MVIAFAGPPMPEWAGSVFGCLSHLVSSTSPYYLTVPGHNPGHIGHILPEMDSVWTAG